MQDLPRIFVPRRFRDSRGWFSEVFREDRAAASGLPCHFVQENQSYSRRAGTVRGLHFQLPPAAQAKLITVPCGRVLDVIVDLRKGSPTYGKSISVELSADNGKQLYVPVGFAHGFLTLEDDVVIGYKVSAYYDAASDKGIRWNDPDLGIKWPVKSEDAIVSDKDLALPALKDFASPFTYNGHPLDSLTVTEF